MALLQGMREDPSTAKCLFQTVGESVFAELPAHRKIELMEVRGCWPGRLANEWIFLTV